MSAGIAQPGLNPQHDWLAAHAIVSFVWCSDLNCAPQNATIGLGQETIDRVQTMEFRYILLIAIGLMAAWIFFGKRRSAGAGKRSRHERVPTRKQDAYPEDLVADFGDLMAEKTTICRDVTELPASKDQIGNAILAILGRGTAPQDVRHALVMAYWKLSDFQPMTEQDHHAVQLWDEAMMSSSETDAAVKKISAGGNSIDRILQVVRTEFEDRSEFLRANGYLEP